MILTIYPVDAYTCTQRTKPCGYMYLVTTCEGRQDPVCLTTDNLTFLHLYTDVQGPSGAATAARWSHHQSWRHQGHLCQHPRHPGCSPETSGEEGREGVVWDDVCSPETSGERERVFWDNVCVDYRLVVRKGEGVYWDDVCVHQRLVVRKGEGVFWDDMCVFTRD